MWKLLVILVAINFYARINYLIPCYQVYQENKLDFVNKMMAIKTNTI